MKIPQKIDFIDPSKPRGTSVIFFDAERRLLLYRRDNRATIPFPDCWDLIGGTVEGNETPDQCITREIPK